MNAVSWLGLLIAVSLFIVTERPAMRETQVGVILETWAYVLFAVTIFSILFSIES